MNKKLIGQNPERYSKMGAQWKISASKNVTPIYLPIGINPLNLLPVLEVDGVMVEVGDYKLISQATLNNIMESNNPHHDLNENGVVKGVSIGKTIPTLRINLDSLTLAGEKRDTLNRNAGVVSVDYIYEGTMVPNTNLSQNIVDQINYTLNPDIDRPKDTYNLAELQLAPIDVYDISTENALTEQDLVDNIFSYSKLSDYLNAVKETQIGLQKDFFLIKQVFWEGKVPGDLNTYKVTKMATAEDQYESDDIQIVYKSAQPIINIVASPPPTTNVEVPKAVTNNDIQLWAISGKTALPQDQYGVYENDPSTGKKGKKLQTIGPGGRFIGSFFKRFDNKSIYKVYDAGGKKVIGYIMNNNVVTGM
jgi:hypothetical protein